MENANKLISFFLGLVVVILVFGIITGRINLKKRLGKTSSPTPTPTVQSVKVTTETEIHPYQTTSTPTSSFSQTYSTKTPTAIPATGSPTLFLPLAFCSLLGGVFLRKKS